MAVENLDGSGEGSIRAGGGAEKRGTMKTHGVACLRCGILRIVRCLDGHRLEPGECPACGYVGWASPREVADAARERDRKHGGERVHLHLVHASPA
jgi:predicted RNA-binding Zn-ribbon protein involved in translation (DUF1610 family)